MKCLLRALCVLSLLGLLAACDATAVSEEPMSRAIPPAVQGMPRTVRILVGDWQLTPTVIAARKGEEIRLQIVGTAGTHQFVIRGMGLMVRIQQGQTVAVGLPTHTTGTFSFGCAPSCGDGQIIITE